MSTKKLKLVGAITLGACSPGCCDPASSGDYANQLCIEMTSAQTLPGADRSIASPAAFVDLLAGTGFTSLRFVLLKISGGFLDVRVSTAAAADQIVRVSDVWMVFSRTLGTEITALAVQGTANIDLVLAA